ncbi:calcium-binding protein [Rhizobium herbae]|uniref:Calcium-binding protein n=1 Tax=Rhizobium herbae TaxID=508661 RepID=A0ABS4ELR0_9HYPH|nr:calcium-binding protein [Rhizobium herbae]MBP1858886.1 hypothetical protein [Rhizobium herbae]
MSKISSDVPIENFLIPTLTMDPIGYNEGSFGSVTFVGNSGSTRFELIMIGNFYDSSPISGYLSSMTLFIFENGSETPTDTPRFSSSEPIYISDVALLLKSGSLSEQILMGGSDDLYGIKEGYAGDDTFHLLLPDLSGLIGGDGTDTVSFDERTTSLDFTVGGGFISIERFVGSKYDDVMRGSLRSDDLSGSDGNDSLLGEIGNDKLYGGNGNDVLSGGSGGDMLSGGAGIDTASYADAVKNVVVSLINPSVNTRDAVGDSYTSIENLTGSSFADKLYGNASANVIDGGSGNDLISGGDGSDYLYGHDGKDILRGGTGNELMYGGGENDTITGDSGADALYGGAGADTFIYKLLTSSTVSSSGRDTIFDFSRGQGDRIDLSLIDAKAHTSGNNSFIFKGTAAYTGHEGELRYVKSGSDTYIYGDVNGDKKSDFAIHLDDTMTLSGGDFIL